jgi:pyruvate formate lyase activating enzyme
VGQPISVRDLVAILERQRPFYEESGGGVTFSGGEPLIQGDFLLACLKTLRKHKIHTAVDTCGFADTELILEVARCADLFLYDLKIMDEALHQKYTKAPLEPILRNLAAIDEAGSKIWIRVPVIPGINDDKDNIAAIGEFVSRLKNTRKLYLLPFHRFGSDKYRRLKMPYLLDKIEPPSVQTMEKIASYLAGFGLEIYIKSAHESKSTASTRTKP